MMNTQLTNQLGSVLFMVLVLVPLTGSTDQGTSHTDSQAIVVPAGGAIRVISMSMRHPNSDLLEPRLIDDLCQVTIEVDVFNVGDLANPLHSHLATLVPGKSDLAEFPFRSESMVVTRTTVRRAAPQVYEGVDADLVNVLCRGTVTTQPVDGKGNVTEGSTTSTFEAEIPFMAGPVPMN